MSDLDIDKLLDELLDASESERLQMLESIELESPSLAERMRKLLGFALAESTPLESLTAAAPNLVNDFALELDSEDDAIHIGERLGAYRIVEKIGRGGMGVVYRAERADGTFEQTVAIKFLQSALQSDARAALFNAERLQLARLEHPNIARIIDAGVTQENIPYYVMEYVSGVSMDDHCKGMSVAETLNLFQQLCQAVGYCHNNLVVHGDIKPNNIMAADGRVRLLDFGISRLLEDSDSSAVASSARAYSSLYSAPEQAAGAALSVVTDIYGLGAVLARLLSVCGSSQALSIGAQPRDTGALLAALESRQLPADLFSIVKKCLVTTPADRYQSVHALERDVDAFVKHHAVGAHPASKGYLLRLFVQRNRLLVGSITLAFGALGIGFGIALWQYNLARTEALRAGEVSHFVQDLFAQVSPWVSLSEKDITMREMLDQAASYFPTELRNAPEVRHEVMQIVGFGYSALHEYDKAFDLHQTALEYWQKTRARPDVNIATAQTALARIHMVRGDGKTAVRLLEDSIQQLEQLGLGQSDVALTTWNRLATAQRSLDPVAAERAAEQYHAIVVATFADQPKKIAHALSILADGRTANGRYAESIELHKQALALYGAGQDSLNPEVIGMRCGLATLQAFTGQWPQARLAQRECIRLRIERFGVDSPELVSARSNMSVMSMMTGQIAESVDQAQQAAELASQTLPTNNAYGLAAESNYALFRWQAGDTEGVEAALQDIISRKSETAGVDHPSVGRIRSMLGRVRLANGEVEQADQLIKLPPAGVPIYWQEDARLWLAELNIRQGNLAAARELLRLTAEARRSSGKFSVWRIAEAELLLANLTQNADLQVSAAAILRDTLPSTHLRFPGPE